MRTYLDHASTSPIRPAARDAMIAWLSHDGDAAADVAGADPGRIHREGMVARVALEQAREQVASMLGARSSEVVFTSGATESIAMASHGARHRRVGRDHVVAAAVEHSAVLQWAALGPSSIVGVDSGGRIDPDEVMAAVNDTTALVHVQSGNHEVGVLQPVAEIVERCRARDVLVHVDAAQSVGHVPLDFSALGADFVSVSAHKFAGPPGCGALLVRRGVRVPPLLLGGDQERARRAGMENLPAAVGFAAAATEIAATLDDEATRCAELSRRVMSWADTVDGVAVLGDREHRLPHIVCLGIQGIEPQPVLLELDRAGIAVHSGSSCSTESLEPSPVLAAMGVDAERSLRISFGWPSGPGDAERLIDTLPDVLARLRGLR